MSVKKGTSQNTPFYVMGIGASAGGLEAINQLLSHVPEHSGFAYIVVQHLSPDHKSLMGELLSKQTRLRVVEAADQMVLEPGHVYLLPSKKTLTVKDGKLQLQEKEKMAVPNNTIDIFFESLSKEYGPFAVAVILSGTGTDGTKGARAVSEKGGVVVVQDPSTSAFNGMPSSAIAAGIANLILPPQLIVEELTDYLCDPNSVRSLRLNTEDDERMLREIIVLIRKVTGQDFGYYKHPTLIRRLAKRMGELNIASVNDYLAYLDQNPAEVRRIGQDFLINVTNFFRDREAFTLLKDEVVPAILSTKNPGDHIKVWTVACSSGEEAYSLAILFHEALERTRRQDINVKIFATDVDKEALETASRGIYSRGILDHVSGQRLAKYFEAEGDNYRVKPEIRKMVVFSCHDVLKDPPFGRLDLVSCRNMLIYINSVAQKEILRKLHFSLNLGGYLFVGPSEHVDVIKQSLEEIDKKWRIYKCINKARIFEQQPFFHSLDKQSVVRLTSDPKMKNPLQNLGEIFKETLLEDQGYAGIFIDQNFEVKQAVGNYKNYIHFPESSFNFNLLKLVHPDLSVALSAAVRKAMENDIPVNLKEVKIILDDKVRLVNVHVKPYLHHPNYSQPFVFIVLEDELLAERNSRYKENVIPENDKNRVKELEDELKETRENLQTVIEEIEATNEELQSANEELVSANEELQSTNEELQSLNEELHTVSAEHQMKIKELMELNDDLNNYFRNSEIGQILVDRNFTIRKFSPSVTRMVNLIPSDINRSLMDITTRFVGFDLIGEISQVIRTGMSIEKELTLDEHMYLLRIGPYERYDRKIDGVVINFIDITRVRQLDSMLEAIFRSVPSAIMATRAVRNERGHILDFEVVSVNAAGERSMGLTRDQLEGRKFSQLFKAGAKEMIDLYRKVLESGNPTNYDHFNSQMNLWTNTVLVRSMDGVVAVTTDINEKKKAAELIERNYEELRKTLNTSKRKN